MFNSAKTFALLAMFFATAFASSYITHRVDEAKLVSLEVKYAQAQAAAVVQAKAVQAAEDTVSLNAAVAEAAAQQKIVTQTITVTKEVVRHVTDRVACVSVGLVRVLNAEVRGVSPDAIPLPAGKSDGSCSGVTNSQLAVSILDNYGLARANAEQLSALEAWVQATIAASHGAPK